MFRACLKWAKSVGVVVLLVLVLGGVVAYVAGVPLPWASARAGSPAPATSGGLSVELVEDALHTIRVPADVQATLKRKGKAEFIAVAEKPTRTRPLTMSGSTALDPARIMRIRARFAPAEVVQVGQVADDPTRTPSGKTELRELRPGDKISKGDVLGIFYSVDVGQKKSDLIDGIIQLRLDQEILDRAEESYRKGALPEVLLLTFRRNVEGDVSTINRAVFSLKTWNIPEEDIQAARDEAEEISKRKAKRTSPTDKDIEKWARVELKAPDDGVIIERNVSLHEIVVDGTTNLFQIAKVNRMVVLANAPEDDLTTLQDLKPDQKRWTVQTVGADPLKGIPGTIDEIGYLIDPNQHTAVIKGHIDNPNGRLRAGQFVTTTVTLDPPKGVVEIPMDAVVDDGRQCCVFLQDPKRADVFTLQRVVVTHRFEKMAYVRSEMTEAEQVLPPEDKEQELLPPRPLARGAKVLTAGTLELKKELEDAESKLPKKAPENP